MNLQLRNLPIKHILSILFVLGMGIQTEAQSPKKLLANGYYEQAFLKAVKKQNKKIKLKKKYANVIYKSYDQIYTKGTEVISSGTHNWSESYNTFVRVNSFRKTVKHPGVFDNLKDVMYDENILGNLTVKFDTENQRDLDKAVAFEGEDKFLKARDVYNLIKSRQDQAVLIPTIKEKLSLIDTEERIKYLNQRIGDQYIDEAEKLLFEGTKENAREAIDLINKAKSHRPLDKDEEELLTLANLIIRDSWMQEAKVLLRTKTKRNGRLAYELINKTRSIKSLTTEEELLLQHAHELGMTTVRVNVQGANGIHTSQTLSGILNKERSTPWITYYPSDTDVNTDLEMEITENKPRVLLGDVRRRLEQRTKQVEYYENETDANGNTVKVKKTKTVTAMVAILSRTKSSHIDWSISLKDKSDGRVIYAENNESKIERTNEFASVESGDILALPENIESEVALDSQPFPTDNEMSDLATQLYVKELQLFLREKKDHLLNLDIIQE